MLICNTLILISHRKTMNIGLWFWLTVAAVFSDTTPLVYAQRPAMMFDESSAVQFTPNDAIQKLALKLFQERGAKEVLTPFKDKNGLVRIEFLLPEPTQNNCSEYAHLYCTNKGVWLWTEEYFVQKSVDERPLSQIVKKFETSVSGKGYVPGICEEGGNIAFWRITTPKVTWYECEIFAKKSNNALVLATNSEPFRAINTAVYGTAYFDGKGTFVRIKTKGKK